MTIDVAKGVVQKMSFANLKGDFELKGGTGGGPAAGG